MINAQAVQAAERRVGGWTYRAEMLPDWKPSYVGCSRVTRYYRYEAGTWREVAWDCLPTAAYRALRRGLAEDAARGPIE